EGNRWVGDAAEERMVPWRCSASTCEFSMLCARQTSRLHSKQMPTAFVAHQQRASVTDHLSLCADVRERIWDRRSERISQFARSWPHNRGAQLAIGGNRGVTATSEANDGDAASP